MPTNKGYIQNSIEFNFVESFLEALSLMIFHFLFFQNIRDVPYPLLFFLALIVCYGNVMRKHDWIHCAIRDIE